MLMALTPLSLPAATLYVNPNSPSPSAPYATWASAAQTIQQAVDASVAGDQIIVTNGIYSTGGQVVFGALSNRVAVLNPVTIQSVNGPQFTVIQGSQVPGTTNGDTAVRCVYLAAGATLSGFTLTQGGTRAAGDYDFEQSGGGVWCEAGASVITNCVLAFNAASYGGGASGGTLNNCVITNNSALGALGAAGGAGGSTLNNCIVRGNWADYYGGGADLSTLNNCVLSGNGSQQDGGASASTLSNCTVTDNSAQSVGGVAGCTLANCIVYFNNAATDTNYDIWSSLNFCCTVPLPLSGYGNIAADPQLASDSHLSVTSPCRSAGSSGYSSGTDIDGENWGNPPAIGCDEYHPGAVTGPLTVGILAGASTVAGGQSVSLTALIDGRTTASAWDFGDGTAAANQPFSAHAWAALGDYTVVLRAYNESSPAGVSANVVVHVTPPTHYVNASSAGPVAPYTSWQTAAPTIQAAVDVSGPGDVILVTNGVYSIGGRVVNGTVTNRVAVDRAAAVLSVNGPQFTFIQGWQGTTNGDGAIRGVYLTNGASLSGFTITNGATPMAGDSLLDQSGGGIWCESGATVSNCVMVGNSANYLGGGTYQGSLNGCALTGNRAGSGGGASFSALTNCSLTANAAQGSGGGAFMGVLDTCALTNNSAVSGGGVSGEVRFKQLPVVLNNCTLVGNTALNSDGGGANIATLTACLVSGNSATYNGGGASQSTLNNCSVESNNAGSAGGGASRGTLSNCVVTGNSAGWSGGADSATLVNCAVSGNSAFSYGGGVSQCTLNNCTVTGNAAQNANAYGGGAVGCLLNNCIVYFNTAGANPNYESSCTFNFSCTIPQPPSGSGNLSVDPRLASAWRLSSTSPCRGAGSATYSVGTDIDGELWGVPPSIGCDEIIDSALTGTLSVGIQAALPNQVANFPGAFTGLIDGKATTSIWDFGDGTFATNQPYTSHAWVASGDYQVVLWAYNLTYPAGVSTTMTVHVIPRPIRYVDANSSSPSPPYDSWANAATNIQDAIDVFDASGLPGGLVLVTNGVYAYGGRAVYGIMTNRVVVDKLLTVQSVNGPQVTIIQGHQVAPGPTNYDGAIRCAYLAGGATLSGFTLTSGATRGSAGDSYQEQTGGGAWCESAGAVISNCWIIGNAAYQQGGGCANGTLLNCTLQANRAPMGGGAYDATLNSCTLTGNGSSSYGGGAYSSQLSGCVLTSNSAQYGGGGASFGSLYNCTLVSNVANFFGGGGVYQCTLGGCTLSGNSSGQIGGGACYSTLENCTLAGNSSRFGGGGSYSGQLTSCTITNNSAPSGGGVYSGTLVDCVIIGNTASRSGGGAYGDTFDPCTLFNCTLTGNTARNSGGGCYTCTLNSCLLTGNSVSVPEAAATAAFSWAAR
jgi:hypothetical protein